MAEDKPVFVLTKRSITLWGFFVIAISLSFAIGMTFSQGGAGNAQSTGLTTLSTQDKNFLVSVANSQLDIIGRQIDWCTSNGGTWNFSQSENEIEVTETQGADLIKAGADVTQKDGKWMAKVVLLERKECILPKKKQI